MRLLLDAMCGGVRAHLRMCGHDAAYALDRGVEADDELLALARAEDRRLVTRDRDLAARADDALLLTERETEGQLRELAAAGVALDLAAEPTRCGRCNGAVAAVAADESTPEYAPDPAETDVWRCRDCGGCFWKGGHWDDVRETLSGL
jgi:uncharacterized protein with PIN domain